MDVRLFIGIGDDVTAESVSRDFGRHYVERSGWNTGNRPGIGNRSVSGRYESVPLVPPDMAKRLDDKKALLLVRGHYGVILDKLNFYTENRFRELVAASERYAKTLVVPAVPLTREWPLFKPKPTADDPDAAWSDHPAESALAPTLTAQDSARRSDRAVTPPTEILDNELEDLSPRRARVARNVAFAYDEGWRLQIAVDEAIHAMADDQAATLAFNLRTKPEVYGALRGSSGLFGSNRRRYQALSAIAEIRRDVLAMRFAVREHRERFAHKRANAINKALAEGDAVFATSTFSAQVSREALVVELITAAEKTLASAGEKADSAAKRAELRRIGETFANARASFTDQDRNENTLGPSNRVRRSKKRTSITADARKLPV